jgi:prepilin-type N-terminal cleavage/methylation domain-containing protein
MTQRRGFTLVEVLIALVIMGIVTGAIYRMLNTNQRLALAQAEQVSLQSNVRTGSLVVPNELRELNTVVGGSLQQNDIIAPLADDGIEYRAMRGLGFVCQAPAAGELRILKATWTGLRDPDGARDGVYLFDDKDVDEDGDDEWVQMDITGAADATCGGAPAFRLTTADVIPASVKIYTPVRLYEVMELKLYSDAGEWWLGSRSKSAGELNLQPVLGPLTEDGFGLEYLDSNGNETAVKEDIKSIRVTVRGLTEDAVRQGGSGVMGHPRDSLVTQVLLRNSIRP